LRHLELFVTGEPEAAAGWPQIALYDAWKIVTKTSWSASIVTVQDAVDVPEAEQAPEMLTPPAVVGGPNFRARMVTWVPCANGATHVCVGGKVHVSPGGWVVTSPEMLE
jgi:hypothetical protein